MQRLLCLVVARVLIAGIVVGAGLDPVRDIGRISRDWIALNFRGKRVVLICFGAS